MRGRTNAPPPTPPPTPQDYRNVRLGIQTISNVSTGSANTVTVNVEITFPNRRNLTAGMMFVMVHETRSGSSSSGTTFTVGDSTINSYNQSTGIMNVSINRISPMTNMTRRGVRIFAPVWD